MIEKRTHWVEISVEDVIGLIRQRFPHAHIPEGAALSMPFRISEAQPPKTLTVVWDAPPVDHP